MGNVSKGILLAALGLLVMSSSSNNAYAESYKLQYSCAGYDGQMPLYRLSGSAPLVNCQRNGYSTIAVSSCEQAVHFAGRAPDGRSVAIMFEAIQPVGEQARLCLGAAGITDLQSSNQAFGAVDQRSIGQACDGAISVRLKKDFDIIGLYANSVAQNGVVHCRVQIR